MKTKFIILLLLLMPLMGCEEDDYDQYYGFNSKPFVVMEEHVSIKEPVVIMLCGALMSLFLCSNFKRKVFT